jgi:hypothetical protein
MINQESHTKALELACLFFNECSNLREIIELMCLDAEAMPNVREMIEGAFLAGYYHDCYTVDSAYACAQAEKCADEFLGEVRK